MISSSSTAMRELYSSLPSEQRQKALAQLAQKQVQTSKTNPVYLQVELAKTTPSTVPLSIIA